MGWKRKKRARQKNNQRRGYRKVWDRKGKILDSQRLEEKNRGKNNTLEERAWKGLGSERKKPRKLE